MSAVVVQCVSSSAASATTLVTQALGAGWEAQAHGLVVLLTIPRADGAIITDWLEERGALVTGSDASNSLALILGDAPDPAKNTLIGRAGRLARYAKRTSNAPLIGLCAGVRRGERDARRALEGLIAIANSCPRVSMVSVEDPPASRE